MLQFGLLKRLVAAVIPESRSSKVAEVIPPEGEDMSKNTVSDMNPSSGHKMAKDDGKLKEAKAARKSQVTPGSNPKPKPLG